MKGGKGISQDASQWDQWEPDDLSQAVSDIQDQHVCVRTCCMRWKSIVVSPTGGGKPCSKRRASFCFAPMLTGSTVWTFHLQYEGWKGQKQRCIAMAARWWLAGRFGYSRSACMCSHLLHALKIKSCFSNWWCQACSKRRASFCFAPMLTGSTVWTFHLQYEGWKGQKQRCIAMAARWWLSGRFGYLKSTCMCSHLLHALNIKSCFSNWWCQACSKRRASFCFAPMLTGSTVWTFHLQYEGWKGQKQRCIAMAARWWLAGRFGYSRSTCMCSHLLHALKIKSCFSNWWCQACSKRRASFCFAPMLTGSTVWTFHLQYEGWKGQKQRCIAMAARWWLAGRFGYSRSTCMCSHLLHALKINSCFSNWWCQACSKRRASFCFAPMLTGSTVWTFHLQYEGWKGQKQRCIAMAARWWLAGRFGYSRSTCMCSHLLHALKIKSCFSNWWCQACSKRRASFCFAPMLTGSTVWTFHLQYEGWKGQKQRCIAMGAKEHWTGALVWWACGKVDYLKPDIFKILNQYCHNRIMRSLKDVSILTGATRINTWFQRWKGQKQRFIATRAWRHVRGGSGYFGLCTLSVKTSHAFYYRNFDLYRYPKYPQIVTFERNSIFSRLSFFKSMLEFQRVSHGTCSDDCRINCMAGV